METINTNGFSIDDAALLPTFSVKDLDNCTLSSSSSIPTSTASDKLIRLNGSMAPRTGSNTVGVLCSTDSSSTDLPKLLSNELKMDTENTETDILKPSLLDPSSSVIPTTYEDTDRCLRDTLTQYRRVRRKASDIMLRLNDIASSRYGESSTLLDDYSSEATESSSDEEAGPPSFSHPEAWHQTRIKLRSHWAHLQSEIVRSADSLNNLKSLRKRCTKLRRSLPLFSQGGLIERSVGTASRVHPCERMEKPRHSYYDVQTISQLDFKYPGSIPPSQVTHPQCRQTCAPGCIRCCPTFVQSESTACSSSTVPLLSLSVDISNDVPKASRPQLLGRFPQLSYRPNLQSTRKRPHSPTFAPVNTRDNEMAYRSYMKRDVLPTCKDEFNNGSRRRYYSNGGTNNSVVGTPYRRSELVPRSRHGFDAGHAVAPRDAFLPHWRKVTYPSGFDFGRQPTLGTMMNRNRKSSNFQLLNSKSSGDSRYPFHMSPPEDTSNAYYERLHADEEVFEQHQHVGLFVSPSSSPPTPLSPP